MRIAAVLCIMLSAAAGTATADPLITVSDEPLNGLPMETRTVTPASAEAAALQETAPSANYLEIQRAIGKCSDELARTLHISKTMAESRCTQRLLVGP